MADQARFEPGNPAREIRSQPPAVHSAGQGYVRQQQIDARFRAPRLQGPAGRRSEFHRLPMGAIFI